MARNVETAYGPAIAVTRWLRANGIDPCDVPINASITIEPAAGGRRIRYTALRRQDGRPYQDPATDRPAVEERTALLKVEPPANVQVKGENA